MHKENPIVRMLPQERMSTTLLGAVAFKTGKVSYEIKKGTNTKNVLDTFHKIIPKNHDEKGTVVYMDMHTSHRSPKVKNYLNYKKVDFKYFPPNCSYLNPVERIWSAFKSRIRMK